MTYRKSRRWQFFWIGLATGIGLSSVFVQYVLAPAIYGGAL
jgi:hypothetical protein